MGKTSAGITWCNIFGLMTVCRWNNSRRVSKIIHRKIAYGAYCIHRFYSLSSAHVASSAAQSYRLSPSRFLLCSRISYKVMVLSSDMIRCDSV